MRSSRTHPELTADQLVETLHEQRAQLCASVARLEHVLAASAIIRAKPTSLRPRADVECESKSAADAAPGRDTHAASPATSEAPERGPVASSGWRFTA